MVVDGGWVSPRLFVFVDPPFCLGIMSVLPGTWVPQDLMLHHQFPL